VFWPATNHKLGRNSVQFYDLLLVRILCYNQVYDMLLVKMLYVATKFMSCYWSELCMVWPSLWFVTGQNTLWYDQVYDLLPVKTLYATTKFMICYWAEHCMLRPSLWFVTGQNTMLQPSLWFVTGQNAVCYDQVYDLLLFRTPYVTISNSYI
jgi:hypothetical protein